jgi:hypothetical protein
MNANMPEIEFEDQRLRHTIASLTSELASCQATLRRSNAELAARTKERDELKWNSYPHMCRDEHPQIGHSDSEHEMCPLCRAIAERNGLAALVLTLNALACYDKRHSWASLCDEQRTAISQLADSVQQAATACLAAHDATVKARAKAEGGTERHPKGGECFSVDGRRF